MPCGLMPNIVCGEVEHYFIREKRAQYSKSTNEYFVTRLREGDKTGYVLRMNRFRSSRS